MCQWAEHTVEPSTDYTTHMIHLITESKSLPILAIPQSLDTQFGTHAGKAWYTKAQWYIWNEYKKWQFEFVLHETTELKEGKNNCNSQVKCCWTLYNALC